MSNHQTEQFNEHQEEIADERCKKCGYLVRNHKFGNKECPSISITIDRKESCCNQCTYIDDLGKRERCVDCICHKTDQYKCPSYFDDNNTLKDCTCGKCV